MVSLYLVWLLHTLLLNSAAQKQAGQALEGVASSATRRLRPWPMQKGDIVVACDSGSCGDHGTCQQSSICKCDEGFFTTDASAPCHTRKKSRILGILLHVLFFALGGGAFYMGWVSYAWAILILCVTPCLCFLFGGCYVRTYIRFQEANQAKRHGWYEDEPPLFEGPSHMSWSERCISCFSFASCLSGLIIWVCIVVWLADGQACDSDGIPVK